MSKYTVRQSGLKTMRAIEVTGRYLPVLTLSESRTYSNFLEFDRRTGALVPEYTEMMEAALRYVQRNEYAIRNPNLIGFAFVKGLTKTLTAEQFAEMCKLNAEETSTCVCHSHDFCDANEVMAEAFESVGVEFDLSDDADRALWSAAWGCAKDRTVAQTKS